MSDRNATLLAMMFLALLTVAATVMLSLNGHDNTITVIVGITGVLSAQLLQAWEANKTSAKVDEVAKNVNGAMTTLVNAKTQPDVPQVDNEALARAVAAALAVYNGGKPPGTAA